MDVNTPLPYDKNGDLDEMEKATIEPSKDGSFAPGDSHVSNVVSNVSSLHGIDILSLQDLDPAMNMKMHLVNNVSGDDRAY